MGSSGKVISRHDDALGKAAEAVRQGYIIAIKGLGGFHLVADAETIKPSRHCVLESTGKKSLCSYVSNYRSDPGRLRRFES